MTKRAKKLQQAFDQQLSSSARDRLRAALGGAKDKAVEKAVPAKKPKGRAARQLKVRTAGGQRCTCRKRGRVLDRQGKCTRCHNKP